MLRVAFVILVGLLFTIPGRASLYQPDDPMPFGVNSDGVMEPLPFGEFKRRLIVTMNQFNPLPLAEGQKNHDRDVMEARIAERKKTPRPTVLDTLALSADLLRIAHADEALNVLKPRDDPRRPDYFVCSTLAHVHAARGEWRVAFEKQFDATQEAAMPKAVKGLTAEQVRWVEKLDRDYVLAYFSLKAKESETKQNPEDEVTPPLFPLAVRNKPHTPVRFVNDRGEYEPGTIAATEKAKLPPDAIAITQQMVLWFPGDTGLYWLLAELYAADGQIEDALTIMKECADTRKYAGRKLLMEHRAALMAAVEKKLKDEEDRRKKDYPISMRMIAIYFGVVALVGVWAGVRAFRRWKARRA